MSSGSINNSAELSGELSSLNIGNNDSEETITICANCGKEGGGDNMNSCNKCDLVKYCNVACKKKHKSKHKKKCEKRAAELFDEKLFEEPPPPEECPICMLPLPYENNTVTFKSCCGKLICSGCIHVMRETGSKNMKLCPFCKTPSAHSGEEEVKRVMKLTEKGNGDAVNQLAGYYAEGILGLPQDWAKANELRLKAGQLGCANGYYNLGQSYNEGTGVTIDKKKAKHYWKLAAINGNLKARNNLGATEYNIGNYDRACKHLLIAAKAGYKESLDTVKGGYMNGYVKKEQYANTMREYQKSRDEMKSDVRDKALAVRNQRMGS